MDVLTNPTRNVVIVGGGISGLSTAYYLQRDAAKNGIELNYTVLEHGGRWGGKVLTETVPGDDGSQSFVVEAGPDSFLTQKPWALQLARELGLGDQLIGTNEARRAVYVVVKGRPVPLPDGVLLIVPTRFMPFVRSTLISPWGKLRMGMDLFLPARKDDGDETLAEFIRRRLGDEALHKIAEPLMSGIYNADAEQQSVMATFPRFRAIEAKYGSLTRGMLAAMKARKSAPKGEKTSAFMSLKGGTNTLIDALVDQLTGDLRLETGLDAIVPLADDTYELHLSDGTTLHADTVIMTTPSYVAADLLRPFAQNAADTLDEIRYVSTGTISLAFDAADVPKVLDGYGLVVPTSENRPINAVTISSSKFDHRAPNGQVLLRAFFGGSRSPTSMHMDDDTLLHTVRVQLRELLGITAAPRFHRIYHWWNANPQYDVNHLERVTNIENALPQGIFITGSAYRGVGLPDCVHQAQQTAAAVLESVPVLN